MKKIQMTKEEIMKVSMKTLGELLGMIDMSLNCPLGEQAHIVVEEYTRRTGQQYVDINGYPIKPGPDPIYRRVSL